MSAIFDQMTDDNITGEMYEFAELLIPFAPAVTISSGIDRLFGRAVLRFADGARSVLSDPLEI